MTPVFHQALTKIAYLSEQELAWLNEKVNLIRVEKGEFLLRSGDICQTIYFIEKGAFKSCYINEVGDEKIEGLHVAGGWLMNAKSFTAQKPSMTNIVAFDTSQVIALHMTELHELIGRSGAFFQLGKIMESVNTIDLQKRPEEKYSKLITENPAIIQTFPLKMIASYLNITPETLSRVRKKISI